MRRHDFRMVLNEEQLVKLGKICRLLGVDGRGQAVAFIIRFLLPLIKNRLFLTADAKNAYEVFHWTDRIQVLMPEEDYQLLKLAHKNYNSFSIAWVVRQLLYFVFDYYDLYGVRCFKVIKQLMKIVLEENKKFQISKNGRQLTMSLWLTVEYNPDYRVISVLSG